MYLLEEIYNNDPGKPQALSFQVNYLIKQKDYQQAMSIAEHVESLFPDKSNGKKLQGDILWAQNKKNEAIDLYRQAYQKQPGTNALFFVSDSMIKEGKSELAIQFLNEELEKNAQNKSFHKAILLKLAATYQQLKQNDKAIDYYEKILTIQDDNLLVLNNLAWMYYTQNNPKAVKLAEKAYKKASSSPQIADTYAVILLEQSGETAKALKILQQAAAKAPNDYAIQFHLAKAYALSDNKTEALKILNMISHSEKDFSEKQAASELLEKLM